MYLLLRYGIMFLLEYCFITVLCYYYVLFEDPDGIRLEINFIPGKGLLKKGESFGSEDDYIRIDGKDKNNDG